jgi:hypothetical protein
MKALISPNELVYLPDGVIGQRVAEVKLDNQIFAVASPLFWVDCADEVQADVYYFDGTSIVLRPVPPAPAPTL